VGLSYNLILNVSDLEVVTA